MESIQQSPIFIALLQIITLVAQAILYARGKNALDIEKHDRGVFAPQVSDAMRMAQEAIRCADNIDVEKYRSLASIVEQQAQTIGQLRAQVLALEESLASLSNKLASRVRVESRAETRAAAAMPPMPPAENQEAAPTGAIDAATLAQFGAIPLRAANNAAPAERPSSFGRKVGR